MNSSHYDSRLLGDKAVYLPNAGIDQRQNLRVPLFVNSYLYPIENSFTGRRRISTYNISSGGIAMFCDTPLRLGETFELLIPVTAKPLLVQASIIRLDTNQNDKALYAAKFIRLCDGEEAMIRETVFSMQIKQHKHSSGN